MLTKIKLPTNISSNYILIKNNKFLILTKSVNSQYILIPNFIKCTKVEDSLHFTCLDLTRIDAFKTFSSTLSNWFACFTKPIIKKLILKGLGLKATLLNDNKTLELKLGFSHIITIDIPKQLILDINKNTISVCGFSLVEVGDFLYRLRSLKFPNAYKGKGIWYKNEIRTFKSVKKT